MPTSFRHQPLFLPAIFSNWGRIGSHQGLSLVCNVHLRAIPKVDHTVQLVLMMNEIRCGDERTIFSLLDIPNYFNPLSTPLLCRGCVVMNPVLINSYVSGQKFRGITLKKFQKLLSKVQSVKFLVDCQHWQYSCKCFCKFILPVCVRSLQCPLVPAE